MGIHTRCGLQMAKSILNMEMDKQRKKTFLLRKV